MANRVEWAKDEIEGMEKGVVGVSRWDGDEERDVREEGDVMVTRDVDWDERCW